MVQELVTRLEEPSTRIFWVARTRAWYFAERGNGVQAIGEWKKRIGREPFGMDAMHYAACVLLFGNTEDADRAIIELPNSFGSDNSYARLAKAYLLASASAPVQTVVAACNQVVELDDSPEMYCGTVEACLVAGDLAMGKQLATVALSKLGKGEDHWRTALEYIAYDLSDDELIRRFDSPMFQGMPDYYVGLRCLATGELDAQGRISRTAATAGDSWPRGIGGLRCISPASVHLIRKCRSDRVLDDASGTESGTESLDIGTESCNTWRMLHT